MNAWIFDAVRTPRGKARAEGGLAAMKPHQLIGGLVDALEARGYLPRTAESLTLGCVGQVGSQGGHICPARFDWSSVEVSLGSSFAGYRDDPRTGGEPPGFGRRGSIAESAVRSNPIVVMSPLLDQHLSPA